MAASMVQVDRLAIEGMQSVRSLRSVVMKDIYWWARQASYAQRPVHGRIQHRFVSILYFDTFG